MDAIKLLSSLLKNNSMGSNILGSLLGGGGQSQGGGGGLGALAGMLGGGGGSKGGVGGLLGSILGSGGQSSGGGGGLGALAGMLGGGAGAVGLLGKLTGGRDAQQVAVAVPQEESQQAEILVRAMCNAAKSDGRLDDTEKEKIIGNLGAEVTQDEIDFVQAELAAPLDVDGFVRQVPAGAATQVYSFSVMGIKIDEQAEANYLGQLAQGLGLDAATCNDIHDQLGAPRIFA